MIVIHNLSWGNCFSFGEDVHISFTDATVTQLVGPNGVGKSSIPLILEEIYYNKNSKGTKKVNIPNRHVDNGYWIKTEFSVNDDTYEIEVKRGKSIKVVLTCNGEDISSHTATNTYKTIEDLLGMDFKTFSQLVYQSTKSSLQFLEATDSNRKKFLIDLFNLERYVDYFNLFKGAAKEASDEVKTLNGEISTLESWLTDNKLIDDNILPKVIIPDLSDEDEKSLRSLSVELLDISSKNQKITKNNKYGQLLKAINITDLQKLDTTMNLVGDLESELSDTNAYIRTANANIKAHQNSPDKCTLCASPIDNSKSLEILKEAKEAKEIHLASKDSLSAELEIRKALNRDIVKSQQEIREWEELHNNWDSELSSTLLQPVDLKLSIENLETRITKAKEAVQTAITANSVADRHNSRVQVIKEQTEGFVTKLDKASAKLLGIAAKAGNLEILKKAFSTNGLVAYKIENLIKELEDLTNEYLGELSSGRFAIEFVISKDKLNVEITDDAFTIDINALSSGELAKVNTATLIAIRKLMSSISKSKINVLFLDEVISVLDEEGKEKLVEVLLEETELNTFVVSHGWTHPLLDKIEVIKENNISRLE